MIPRLLVLPGTAIADSGAARLAGEATRLLAVTDVALTAASLADYPLPLFDAEPGVALPPAGRSPGLPENARLLAQRLALQDGLLIVAPAVHDGVAPLLANAVAWIAAAAREQPQPVHPFHRLVVGLASTSHAPDGGRAALAPLRAVLQALGAEVVTPQCAVCVAGAPFEASGRLADETYRRHLDDLAETLLDHARALGRQS
ncbi:NADPH-dependent FMN reductase [Aureimonas pseudogalii]|uniref:NAD(P)H-dependent FMN reductase n=1 Tax=Aureimonas pseudogalii TaxID=1744844 RepID=A0A7W6EAG5_9HYPH|nr:NAD(P)H-dependent oxidoreductase [Aureimonas pseudogalii]MBB3997717.1 NAD(P)H-dependent FMN reductase [Aureimonas pseudogalii]